MALERGECPRVYCPLGNQNAIVIQPASDATFTAGGKQAGVRGPSGASLQPMRRVRAARAGRRAVRDSTLVAWYRCVTHLAREGRMTVTIGRRELLVALGSAAVAWPLGTALALNMGDIHYSVELWRCETPL